MTETFKAIFLFFKTFTHYDAFENRLAHTVNRLPLTVKQTSSYCKTD